MRETLKNILQSVAPRAFERLQARRARRHVQHLMRTWGVDRVAREFTSRHGWSVRAGPFAGMRLIDDVTWTGLVPKLIGSYECEIAGELDRMLAQPYEVVADVGCADGYYAVGIARRQPRALVYAFDLDHAALRATRSLAKANKVAERVQLHGRCDAAALNVAIGSKRALVISDCEGFEDHLINPRQCPALRNADLIVEMHDHASPGVTERVVERLTSTHDVLLITAQPRNPDTYPLLADFTRADRGLAVSEFRVAGQIWGVFRSRSR